MTILSNFKISPTYLAIIQPLKITDTVNLLQLSVLSNHIVS